MLCHCSQTSHAKSSLNPFCTWCNMLLTVVAPFLHSQHSPPSPLKFFLPRLHARELGAIIIIRLIMIEISHAWIILINYESHYRPDWKEIHPLSQSLTPLGKLGSQLRAPHILFNVIVLWWSEWFHGGPQLGPCDAGKTILLIVVAFTSKYSEISSESCWVKLKSDCGYHFPIDLKPNRLPFGANS